MRIKITTETSLNRRKEDLIGNNLPDVFMDSYTEDRFACHDIIERLDNCETPFAKITIDKKFLERLARSHICMIKEFEKGMTGINYAR